MLKYYVWNIPGLSLLIPSKSGILYANQTGGHATLEHEIEGWLLPLMPHVVDQESLLHRHFTGPRWRGYCSDGIDAETAAFVDDVLQMHPCTAWLRVDLTRLADSLEAWIHVVAERQTDIEVIEFHDFTFTSGILIWRNSD